MIWFLDFVADYLTNFYLLFLLLEIGKIPHSISFDLIFSLISL